MYKLTAKTVPLIIYNYPIMNFVSEILSSGLVTSHTGRSTILFIPGLLLVGLSYILDVTVREDPVPYIDKRTVIVFRIYERLLISLRLDVVKNERAFYFFAL
jgi:hypothetical protein